MQGGLCWYLADASFKGWAHRATDALLCDGQDSQRAEILKKADKRLIFRLKSPRVDYPHQSVVVKAFPMTGKLNYTALKLRLLRYRRYGPSEARNLLEAARRGLPVPQVFDWSLAPTPGEGPKGVYLPNSSGDVVAGGIVIAEYGEDRPFLIDYDAGTDFDAGNGTTDKYGVAGARRAFIGHWGYDDGTGGTNGSDGGPSDWEDYLTDDYKDIFAGTVATMIPEPATLVLLGLGGILLRRRR